MSYARMTTPALIALKAKINAILDNRRKAERAELFNRAVEMAKSKGFELADLDLVPTPKKRGRPPGKAKKLTKLKKSAAKKIRKPVRGRMAA